MLEIIFRKKPPARLQTRTPKWVVHLARLRVKKKQKSFTKKKKKRKRL
jgi:hypothetical protein